MPQPLSKSEFVKRYEAGEFQQFKPKMALGHGPDVPGNIDLTKQPKVSNPDGTYSTVDSRSYQIDGQEVLLPSVTPDGRHLKTDEDIINEYTKTGRHLGKFSDFKLANDYAQKLHEDYAAGKYDQPTLTDKAVALGRKVVEPIPAVKAGAEQLANKVQGTPGLQPPDKSTLTMEDLVGAVKAFLQQPKAAAQGLMGGALEGAASLASPLNIALAAGPKLGGAVKAALNPVAEAATAVVPKANPIPNMEELFGPNGKHLLAEMLKLDESGNLPTQPPKPGVSFGNEVGTTGPNAMLNAEQSADSIDPKALYAKIKAGGLEAAPGGKAAQDIANGTIPFKGKAPTPSDTRMEELLKKFAQWTMPTN